MCALLGGGAQGLLAAGVSLAWEPPAQNVDGSAICALTGYRIYYGTAAAPYTTCLDVGLTPRASITGLTQGAAYHFVVTACSSAGTESAFSKDLAWGAATSAWAAPVLLGLDPDGSGGVTLNWSSVPGQVFALQRSFCLTQPFQDCVTNILATPPCNTTRDVPPAGTNGTVYYRVLVTS